MFDMDCDVAVVGGGPAGLAAAVAARKEGAEKVLIIERDSSLGGILQQCIHPGFGLTYYHEELTGPEYAGRFVAMAKELGVEALLDSMVLEVAADRTVVCVNRAHGVTRVKAKAVVLAMGCRERTRGAIQIPGSRPAGIYTAGAAQRLINRQNEMVGRQVVILGSGDIGMIMARRMTLEGAKVEAVFEILPYSSGLPRNIQQCLVDYDIPLYLSTTVTEVVGMRRLEGVKVAQVDDMREIIPETERFVPCDTLLLSVGLIPENELARAAGVELDATTGGPKVDDLCMTSVPGIFSCGNALHVHDLVDWASEEADWAGRCAAMYAGRRMVEECGLAALRITPGRGVRYVMPETVCPGTMHECRDLSVALRVQTPSRNGVIEVVANGEVIRKERHSRLHPAEMVRVPLMSCDLEKCAADGVNTLEVRVR